MGIAKYVMRPCTLLDLQLPKHPVQFLPLLPSAICLWVQIHELWHLLVGLTLSLTRLVANHLGLQDMHPTIQPSRRHPPFLCQLLAFSFVLPLLERAPCVGFQFREVLL